jgi:hypothetical protein
MQVQEDADYVNRQLRYSAHAAGDKFEPALEQKIQQVAEVEDVLQTL